MDIICLFAETFDSFKTTTAISNTEIYGESKTVRLAKSNVESLERPL